MTPYKIRKEILIDASPEQVYAALTDPAVIRDCFFGAEVVTDWQEGSDIVFQGEYEGTSYRDKGRITAAVPAEKFQYTYWSSFSGTADAPENHSLVTYELLRSDAGITELVLTQENLTSAEAQQHADRNWDFVLERLREIIENHP